MNQDFRMGWKGLINFIPANEPYAGLSHKTTSRVVEDAASREKYREMDARIGRALAGGFSQTVDSIHIEVPKNVGSDFKEVELSLRPYRAKFEADAKLAKKALEEFDKLVAEVVGEPCWNEGPPPCEGDYVTVSSPARKEALVQGRTWHLSSCWTKAQGWSHDWYNGNKTPWSNPEATEAHKNTMRAKKRTGPLSWWGVPVKKAEARVEAKPAQWNEGPPPKIGDYIIKFRYAAEDSLMVLKQVSAMWRGDKGWSDYWFSDTSPTTVASRRERPTSGSNVSWWGVPPT